MLVISLLSGGELVIADKVGTNGVGFALDVGVAPLPSRVSILSTVEAARKGFLFIDRLGTGLAIDGDVSDWPGAVSSLTLPGDCGSLGSGGGGGNEDLGAIFRAAWNDDALYVAATVFDDRHNAPVGLPMWHRDGLRIAVDPFHEKTLGTLGVNDTELAFALLNDGRMSIEGIQFPYLQEMDNGVPVALGASAGVGLSTYELGVGEGGIQFSAQRMNGETTYEIAIPWATLGVPVSDGSVCIGFNFVVTENDGLGRHDWIEMAPGFVPALGMERDASRYLTVVGTTRPFLLLVPAGVNYRPGLPIGLTAMVFPGGPLGESAMVRTRGPWGISGQTREVVATLPYVGDGVAMIESEWAAGQPPQGMLRLSASLFAPNGVVLTSTACSVTVGSSVVEIAGRLQALNSRWKDVEKRAVDANALGIATDYEMVVIATVREFVGYGLADLEDGLVAKSEHVVNVLEVALGDASARLEAFLSGETEPIPVPRFVTGRITLTEGQLWGETLMSGLGTRERRPVFFTGYGFFDQVVSDIPKFRALGCNIIQSSREGGGGGTVVSEGKVSDHVSIGSVARAEKHDVVVDWLSNTEYFPHWARKRWPELEGAGGAFYDIKVDAPQARRIFKLNLEACLRAIGDSSALHSVCLMNEPTSEFWEKDQFRLALWRRYLERRHHTIGEVNELEGTNYKSFVEVPVHSTRTMPPEEEMSPLRYDQVRFNMDRFAEFHRFLSDVIHKERPGTLTHTKTMAMLERDALHYGTDPDQFAYVGDLNGNDTWNKFVGEGDRYATLWWRQDMFCDLQRSLRPVPIINSENHIIGIHEMREIPPAHTDCVLWQGAIHGIVSSIIWVWEHVYSSVRVDHPRDYHGDSDAAILTRPENVMAVGQVGLDLMRLAPEVYKMQAATSPIAIFYGITAQIWSDRADRSLKRTYEAMSFNGLPVVFVSERQAREGGLSRFRAVVLPSIRHVPEDVARAVLAYVNEGGQLWIVGNPDETMAYDEYGRVRKLQRVLPQSSIRAWPETTSVVTLRASLLEAFDAVAVQRPVLLRDERGSEPWAIDYRAVGDGNGYLLSMANYWGTPKRVSITVDGQVPSTIRDLRKEVPVNSPQIELKPLEALFLRVE